MYSFLQLKLNSQDDVFLACAEPDPASERDRANGGFHIFKIFLLIDQKNDTYSLCCLWSPKLQ